MKDMILLRSADASITAVLSETAAARDFKRRLPLTVSGTRIKDSYRFLAAIGRFDPEETQTGWKNGDISLAGGWLKVFFDGEEDSGSTAGVMVVAHISQRDLAFIKNLPAKARLRIEAAE